MKNKMFLILLIPAIIVYKVLAFGILYFEFSANDGMCLPGFRYSLISERCITTKEYCSFRGGEYKGIYPVGYCDDSQYFFYEFN
jgi:hypothetical protein